MKKPVRLQLSRKKGFNLQKLSLATNGLPAVVVSRPSKWGNPYKIGEMYKNTKIDLTISLILYGLWLEEKIDNHELDYKELEGKNLACYCEFRDEKLYGRFNCHADVILDNIRNLNK